MPVLDMSIEELKRYMGSSPCPTDIDEYWDKALQQMEAIDPQVELIPSAFQADNAECFDLYFTGVGGARVHVKYARPRNRKAPAPAVLMFHGYSANAGDWLSKLSYVGDGFCVAAMDCRGQGGLSEDNGAIKGPTLRGHIIRGLLDSPENLFYRSVFLDAAQLAKIVMGFEEVDENRVGAMGGSQGGALSLVCAALMPSIKLVAANYPFLSDYKRVWHMDKVLTAYTELREFFIRFDPTHEREDEHFYRLGYIDIQNLTKRIQAEVLMFTGLQDETCPPSSQFAAYNKITSKKQVVFYPDLGHTELPGAADRAFEFMHKL